jgi:hypothetical protein
VSLRLTSVRRGKDNPKGIGQTFSAVVEVEGLKGEEVQCTLTNRTRSRKFLASDDFGFSGTQGPGSIALNLKGANSFGNYFTIDCVLPPFGKLYSYWTFGPSPTDID